MIEHGVYLYGNVVPEQITRNGLTVMIFGEWALLKANTVVIATGSESDRGLYDQLKGLVSELHLIGDLKPQGIHFCLT